MSALSFLFTGRSLRQNKYGCDGGRYFNVVGRKLGRKSGRGIAHRVGFVEHGVRTVVYARFGDGEELRLRFAEGFRKGECFLLCGMSGLGQRFCFESIFVLSVVVDSAYLSDAVVHRAVNDVRELVEVIDSHGERVAKHIADDGRWFVLFFAVLRRKGELCAIDVACFDAERVEMVADSFGQSCVILLCLLARFGRRDDAKLDGRHIGRARDETVACDGDGSCGRGFACEGERGEGHEDKAEYSGDKFTHR